MTKQANSQEQAARPRRSPLDRKNRLSVKNREPGYVYRIANIQDDNIELLKERGYEICEKERVGAVGDKRVDNPSSLGSASEISVGAGDKAVVMRIREDWYKEDQATKQAVLDEVERSMGKDKSDYGKVTIALDR